MLFELYILMHSYAFHIFPVSLLLENVCIPFHSMAESWTVFVHSASLRLWGHLWHIYRRPTCCSRVPFGPFCSSCWRGLVILGVILHYLLGLGDLVWRRASRTNINPHWAKGSKKRCLARAAQWAALFQSNSLPKINPGFIFAQMRSQHILFPKYFKT